MNNGQLYKGPYFYMLDFHTCIRSLKSVSYPHEKGITKDMKRIKTHACIHSSIKTYGPANILME